ncbi:MAG: TatD family hydrolase [Dethiobacteria bacterium]|nr:TatD family hydrolase [Bacillota bacterium]MDW7729368.1 TatD family hydrolase [Bacillota bacterium]
MPVLIDTHAHLDFPQFRNDLDVVLKRARDAGIAAILNAGADEGSSKRSVELSLKYPWISASVGIHPHSAAKAADGWLKRLEMLAENDTVLAIGETGLDYYRNLSPHEDQELIFREQLRLACRTDKPVIIHSRQAHNETLKILKEEELPSRVGVMHCFSGSFAQMEKFLELGFYISIAGPVTYPKSHELRDLLKFIPSDRLLLETDAPYLPPQAYRSERNEPAFIRLTYERVALTLDQDLEQLSKQLYLNAVRLFSDNLVDRD